MFTCDIIDKNFQVIIVVTTTNISLNSVASSIIEISKLGIIANFKNLKI